MDLKQKLEKDLAELKAEKHLYCISEYVCVKELMRAQYENHVKDDYIMKLVKENFKLKNQAKQQTNG